MASKFKAWLRVSPSPTTLTESSAIFKQLKSQGQIQGFRQATHSELTFRPWVDVRPSVDSDSMLFYATFVHEPLHLRKSFDVAVYHDLADPKEADPYNIRGLQNRKPFPASKTFSCVLEKVEEEGRSRDRRPDNPWHGQFLSEKGHWFQAVLEETGAPPGIGRGLSVVDHGSSDDGAKNELLKKSQAPGKKFEMNTLMKTWQEAAQQPSGNATGVRQPRSGTAPSPRAANIHE